VEPY